MLPTTDHRPEHGYDPVARTFHWMSAVLVGLLITLGLTMTRLPVTTEAQAETTFALFSLHKTVGLVTLLVAMARILWSLTHRRPGPLHPDRRLESFTAEVVHWSLYGALIVLPVSGWLHHAARPGFAPIVWPFGQTLPYIPASQALANVFQTIHRLAGYTLCVALVLHVLGALKHAIVDRDATLQRMSRGVGPAIARMRFHPVPVLTALALWALVVAIASTSAPAPQYDPFADIDMETGALPDESAPVP